MKPRRRDYATEAAWAHGEATPLPRPRPRCPGLDAQEARVRLRPEASEWELELATRTW